MEDIPEFRDFVRVVAEKRGNTCLMPRPAFPGHKPLGGYDSRFVGAVGCILPKQNLLETCPAAGSEWAQHELEPLEHPAPLREKSACAGADRHLPESVPWRKSGYTTGNNTLTTVPLGPDWISNTPRRRSTLALMLPKPMPSPPCRDSPTLKPTPSSAICKDSRPSAW